MTATINQTYDVFISHAARDQELAREIAERLESEGLASFHDGLIPPGADIGRTIWDALAESRALIAIISPDMLPQAMGLVEIGAAAAWNKPFYVIINGPSSTKLPNFLSNYPAYPLNRLEEVVRAIQSSFDPLTESEREILSEIYLNLGTPTDQLSQSPKALRELTSHFNKSTKKQYSGERLLSELIRLRKKGELPRLST